MKNIKTRKINVQHLSNTKSKKKTIERERKKNPLFLRVLVLHCKNAVQNINIYKISSFFKLAQSALGRQTVKTSVTEHGFLLSPSVR